LLKGIKNNEAFATEINLNTEEINHDEIGYIYKRH